MRGSDLGLRGWFVGVSIYILHVCTFLGGVGLWERGQVSVGRGRIQGVFARCMCFWSVGELCPRCVCSCGNRKTSNHDCLGIVRSSGEVQQEDIEDGTKKQ